MVWVIEKASFWFTEAIAWKPWEKIRFLLEAFTLRWTLSTRKQNETQTYFFSKSPRAKGRDGNVVQVISLMTCRWEILCKTDFEP